MHCLPDAVLWDMDGTLIDTEPSWMAAERALVAEHGGTWRDEQAQALIGNPLLVSAEVLRRDGGVALHPLDIVDRLLDEVVADVRRRVPWQPGARELLDALSTAGVPCGLVTMSWRRLVDAVLAALPPDTFAAVVSGDEVRLGKPDPEPYLRAVELLGVDAERCVAIEDSPPGAAAAAAAGCHVVTVPHLAPVPPGPGHVQVPDLTGIDPAWLGRLVAHGPATRS